MAGHPYIPSNIGRILEPKKVEKRPPGNWKRKLEAEILKERKILRKSSFDLVMPTGLGLCLSMPFVLSGIYFSFDPEILKASLKVFILIFSITFVCQVISGRSFVKRPKIKICNNCYRENDLNMKKCACGGVFEPPEFYVYVEKEVIKDN